MQKLNPATGKTNQAHISHTPSEVEAIIAATHSAQIKWRDISVKERAGFLGRVAGILLKQQEELARICSEEMGKTFKEAIAEVKKCASGCQYYAENAEAFLAPDKIQTEAKESYVIYQPLGLVLAIMPWNFPFWQAIRFAAPGLCAGNGVLLKHASNVPGCAMALEQVFREGGLPENIFRTLLIPSSEVKAVIQHPLVKAVTLTGSTAAGRAVAKDAGESLKKVVLELGGSDAYIVLDDADLEHAANTLVQGRMLNAGQSCISPKRIIAVSSIYQKYKQLALTAVKKISYGDPFDSSIQMGSMARKDLRDQLHQQVTESIARGAQRLCGGEIPQREGAFYPPTMLSEVKPGMPAFDDELFGPVFCLIEAKDEAHAIELANQSIYGLGGGVFSQDLKRAQKVAAKMESGGVFINDFLKSDPRLPFGGIKQSGHGRELSFHGIKEFVNAKTIVVK